jgi:TRAP-type transport system periplasmic protein
MKKFKLGLMLILLLVFMAACGSQETQGDNGSSESKSDKKEVITLKAGGVSSPKAPTSKAIEKFAELVKEKTNGEVVVDFYPAEQLGDGNTQVDNLRSGLQDIFASDVGYFAGLQKDFNILGMPYLFKDHDQFKSFLQSPVFKDMEEKLLETNEIRVLANNWARLPRIMISTKPVETPDDVKGMKVRVPDIPIFIKHVERLDASPTPVAWGEVYMGLQQGVIQAENPTKDTIFSSKFYEVAPYIIELEHTFTTNLAAISEKAYQKLSPEQQKAITEAAVEAGEYHAELVSKEWEEQKGVMKEEGAKFLSPDPAPFREKVLPMADELEKSGLWSEGLLEKVNNFE